MTSQTLMKVLGYTALTIVVSLTLNIFGCFDSGGDGNNNGGTSTQYISLNVGASGQDIDVTAGEVLSMVFPIQYDIQKFGGPFDALELNLEEHLSAVVVTLPKQVASSGFTGERVLSEAVTGDSAQMFLRVAAAEAAATVCALGELYGPFQIMLDDTYQPAAVTPSSATATQATIDVINTGAYSICVQILPPIDATVDLNRLGFTVSECGDRPANISGDWGGTYSCTDNCDSASGSVLLTITQDENDPTIASYTDDSGASYQGSVCGNRFSFKGGLPDSYNESGTFVLNADGTASKTSTYAEIPPGVCTGTCIDALVRIDGGGGVIPDGTCDVNGLSGHPVRFVLTPDTGGQVEVQPCAAFECNTLPDTISSCTLQVFDIAGTDRYLQFLTPENTGICFGFDARIQHPETGVVYTIYGEPQRVFGDNSIPFATGSFTGSDGSIGTFEFFEYIPGETGFKGFVNPIPFIPCSDSS